MTLSTIVLSYNTKELLDQTLASIPEKKDWEVIVVDNASSDGSPEMVAAKYPKVTVIRASRNLGFAAGNNLGIKVAKGKYFMILNSDTKVLPSAFETLVSYLDRNPKVAAITPKVTLPDGAIDLACHRGMPTPWNAFTYYAKLEQLFPSVKLFSGYHQTYKDFTKIHEIDASACTALMVRKKAIDEVGLLDERFFLYAEDLDWCKRLTDAGWKIVYHPEAEVLHFKSQSGKRKNTSKKDREQRQQAIAHFYDTMKQFYEKHYQKRYPKPLRQLVYLGIDLKKRWDTRK